MPRDMTTIRVARSFVTPAAATVDRVLDFQLAVNQGIKIHAVLGLVHAINDSSPVVSDTAITSVRASHHLHMEEGTLEPLPDVSGEDEDDIDTEIFWAQAAFMNYVVGSTATFGAGPALFVSPNGLTVFPEPILSARNITHSGVAIGTDILAEFQVLIYYNYVVFSNAELGLLLARRA